MRSGPLWAPVVGLVAATCGRGTPAALPSSPSPSATMVPPASPGPTPAPTPNLRAVSVRMVRIATLTQPLAMAVRSDDAALYVAEKGGRVVAIRGGTIDPTPVLDISSKVSNGGEQGLLGIAFSPDGQYLYVSYTDVSGNTNIVQYSMGGGRSVVGSARRVLFVSQPYANHNGGNIAFGPDGDLYLGLGDGGSEGDPLGNGQALGTLLGKLIRIDPHPSAGKAYTIPADNPFAGR